MPTETVKTSEQFALSGLPVHLLVLAGIAMTVLVMFLAWRDGRLTRVWLTPVLTVLRVVAIVIVLWMLAGPSIVRTVTHTKTKNVAVVVDTSGSMGVSDPTDEPMAARWSQAAAPADATPGFVKLDEASAALAVASSQLARL